MLLPSFGQLLYHLSMEGLYLAYQADLDLVSFISQILETMTIDDLSDKSEIDSSRIMRILSLDVSPTLGEIKRIAGVVGKNVKLQFV